MKQDELIKYFNRHAETRDHWKARNWYYHRTLERLLRFIIPEKGSVLEIGSGTGDLLAHLKPSRGLGIDISPAMIGVAGKKYPHLEWRAGDAENLALGERFDYVVLSDLIGFADDIERVFAGLSAVTHPRSRVVITYYNYFWEPILRLSEIFHLKARQPLQNWMSPKDIENMLTLAGFEVIKSGNKMIFPVWIPFLSAFLNTFVANLPLISRLGVIQYVVARPRPEGKREYSVSIVIPCRNEKGNIKNAVERTPQFGTYTEIIFVESGSHDGTFEEIKRVAEEYAGKKNIRYFEHGPNGTKGSCVRQGFREAKGDVLMILDADLTMQPEDLPKYYRAIASGRGEFINGSRLVYQLEDESMRFLNILGNKFFSIMFSWLLGQRLKDTLCGTKVLFKLDYEKIADGRKYFGDFDPFGDFDLLFGAAKLNLKIVEIPIRYQARTYGSTQIQRWRHGRLLLKMTFFAMRKIKFI
ncbi:MAG: glycosyl transferase [Candidatus Ryanbacteria bacterium RIFCSPLOWO2_12_FULL_47_9c]|uniref:Glycosyl transferase n=1 Tax=Candidatus Ryanbacteria bacterium RIFCSPLOWO2_12_FULL_47_9c TaxID=1802131 RepID=A0A1G2H2H6_9BACT|nr:MAG: glycosyl transferase [Candidatus Ryanbacteria bacterium RIFCSPLOWO2_12_FULL_47_9c]